MAQHNDLKKTGLKATLPRLKVLSIFESNRDKHLSAENVKLSHFKRTKVRVKADVTVKDASYFSL